MDNYFESDEKIRPDRRLITESVPLIPHKETWEIVQSPERLMKTFGFNDRLRLIDFVREVLVYENRINHHGQIRISHLEVSLEVYTRDLNRVTDRDREYAMTVDLIRQDVDHYAYEEKRQY